MLPLILPEPHFEQKVIFPTTLIGMSDKTYQPTIAGLRAFVAVAEKQHFGSAATILGVSQSTLSQALSALETGLGVQLVERSTRRVFLTDGRQAAAAASASGDRGGDGVHRRGRGRLGSAAGQHPAGPDPDGGAVRAARPCSAGLADRLPALTLRVIEDQTERLLTGLREGRSTRR